jgi:hypothetical protein
VEISMSFYIHKTRGEITITGIDSTIQHGENSLKKKKKLEYQTKYNRKKGKKAIIPSLSFHCKKGQHYQCTKKHCTCDCGHKI